MKSLLCWRFIWSSWRSLVNSVDVWSWIGYSDIK